MDDVTLQAKLDNITELLVTLLTNQHAAAPAVVPPPAAPVVQGPPKRVYHYDADGLLAVAEGVTKLAGNGPRVDPIVDADCTTAVFLPKTGHYLSVARPDLGEMFPGYAMRVSKQASGDIGKVGSIFIAGNALFDPYGGYKKDGSNWPQVADGFFNPTQRQVDPQWEADDAARRARNVQPQPAPAPAPTPAPVDVPVA